MRVAVTGANGYVGRAIVRALLARGHAVDGLVRSAGAAPPAGARAVTGDLRDPRALAALVAGANAVVHAAAWVHRRAESAAERAECEAVNVGGTRALVDAMRASPHARQMVFVSTTAVYGAATENVAEDAPKRPATTYGATKLAAEGVVLGASAEGAITACALRPCIVYGERAPGNVARLASLVRRGWVPLVRGGGNLKSLVHVDDLAAAVLRALERPTSADGRAFNVAGAPLGVRAIAEAIGAGLGVTPRFVPIPLPPLRAAAALAGGLARLTGGAFPDLGRSAGVFAETSTVDAGAIVRTLGVAFRDPREGLAAAAAAERGAAR